MTGWIKDIYKRCLCELNRQNKIYPPIANMLVYDFDFGNEHTYVRWVSSSKEHIRIQDFIEYLKNKNVRSKKHH